MKKVNGSNSNPQNWKYESSEKTGFHEVISPKNSTCKTTWIFRLNLNAGMEYALKNDELELSLAIIKGSAKITFNTENYQISKMDSVYLPAGNQILITAIEDLSIFLGGGPYEGEGEFFVRHFDLTMPIGDIHQIHGEPPYERTVFMTVNQEVPASRLITGFTWGNEGGWTSWPPHEHTKDLEEVYCYFDIPKPQYALHIASQNAGTVGAVHQVSSGDCVVIPEGYHPTVGIPGVKSCYFWVMVAHCKESRRYDLAVSDPNYTE